LRYKDSCGIAEWYFDLHDVRSKKMKARVRHGLSIVVGLVFSAVAMASEPIVDKDAFEKRYIDCIMSGAKDNCLVSIFSNHRDPQFRDQDGVFERLNKYYLEKIASPSVYKVHVIEKTMKAGIFDNRSYLIERDNGSLAGFYVSFRNIKGKWFMFAFKFNNSDEFVYKLLGMPTENVGAKNDLEH
jgi:hypothetical protein